MSRKAVQILLVDDNKAHIELVRRALEPAEATYHLLAASSLTAARSLLKKTSPSLIIVDYRLPDGAGLELLPGSTALRTVPIILLTGHGDEKVAAQAMRAGAMDYIIKSDETLADMAHIIERSLREWRHITKHRQTEEKALSLNKIFEESLNEIYIFETKSLKFIQVNRGARRNLGYTTSELRRLTALDLKPELSQEAFAKIIVPLQTGEKEKIRFTTVHRRKDGTCYPVEAHLQLSIFESRPVFVAIILDITERKKSEQSLRDLQTITRQIIDTAPDAFVSMAADGRITDWNPQAELTFGWGRQQAIGLNLSELLIPSRFRAAHNQRLQQALSAGEDPVLNGPIEMTALHRDGHEFPVELSVVAVHNNGQVSFNSFIRNLTDQTLTQQALKNSLTGTIEAISRAFEVRDPYTAGHQRRVARLAQNIAETMDLESGQVEGVRMGATIHDLGKIYLPAEILSKPTKLSTMEFALVKTHSQVGHDILNNITFPWPIADVVFQHHERLDGSGYPQGLKADEICLEARITAVADVVEAMSSHRPYRPSLGIEAALEEIEHYRGEKFDADATDACLMLFREQGFILDETPGLSKP